MVGLLAFALVTSPPVDLYVSPTGSDRRNGRSWDTAFQSAERAKAAVVAAKGNAIVHLNGSFHLSKPLVLDGSCSHSRWIGESWAAFDGGIPLSGWAPGWFNGFRVWSCPCPSGVWPRAFFAGRDLDRRPRPRLPETGYFHFAGLTNNGLDKPWNEGQSEAIYNPDDFAPVKDWDGVELVALQRWVTSILPVASVDPKTSIIKFTKKSTFQLGEDNQHAGGSFYLDNVAQSFREQGQWYWSRANRRIYYIPTRFDRISDFQAEVAAQPNLLTIQGANDIKLLSLEFRGCNYELPSASAGDGQAAISVPGAVVVKDSHAISVTRCRVRASETYGAEILGSSTDCLLDHCRFDGLGGGGVKVGHGTKGTTVSNCIIQHDGLTFESAVGVWVGNSGYNTIVHNQIKDLGYTGISVGWTWGYGKSDANHNLVAWNDIGSIGRGLLSDMGGIYTLGVSPGTVLAHNTINGVKDRTYGGWGIYLDEGSSQIQVQQNLVVSCQTGSFHQHYGQDNVIERNDFLFAPSEGQIIRTRPENHRSFTMDHNVIMWTGTPLFGGNLTGPGFDFHDNLLCNADAGLQLPKFVDASNKMLNLQDPLKIGATNKGYGFPISQQEQAGPVQGPTK
jgi:hypothetical protein